MKKILTTISLIVCLVALNADMARAGVPQTINYRGRLVDSSGAPVADGANFITFSIYSVPTGGTALWTSGIQAVTSGGGLFSYELGSNVALPTGLFSDNAALYLGIQIGVDSEIGPRTQFTSSAFALQAEHADLAASAESAQSLGGQPPSYYLDWNNLTGLPAGFADGVDNVGSGDITGVAATNGLTGGGTTGDVIVEIAKDGITADHIAAGAIGPNAIAPNSLTANELATGSVGSAEIAIGAVGSSEVLDNSLTSFDLAENSVTASEIAPFAVRGSEIFDGSITDIDISPSAGIATTKISGTAVNVASAQTITGSKTFNNLKVPTTTRRISLSSAAFVNSTTTKVHRVLGGYLTAANTRLSDPLFVELFAQVSLPDGAVITQLEGTFRDIDDANDANMLLIRSVQSTGAISTVASLRTTSTHPNVRTFTATPIANATVNNESYRYFLYANWRTVFATGLDFIRLYGAEVQYTITRPLP